MKKAIVCILVTAILMLGACGVMPDFSTEVSGTPSPGTENTPEQDLSIHEAVEGKKVISGDAGAEEEQHAELGEILISQSVGNSIKSPQNTGAYFYVKLSPNFGIGADFEFEGKQYEEWSRVAQLKAYDEAYEVWLEEVFPALDEEMKAAEERGEEQAQGWKDRDPREYFDIYYEHTQSEEVITAWKAAKDKANAAKQAYEEYKRTDEYYEQKYELLLEEVDRLKADEYLVELDEWTIRGYLTKEQIEGFDRAEYGYAISWAEKEA